MGAVQFGGGLCMLAQLEGCLPQAHVDKGVALCAGEVSGKGGMQFVVRGFVMSGQEVRVAYGCGNPGGGLPLRLGGGQKAAGMAIGINGLQECSACGEFVADVAKAADALVQCAVQFGHKALIGRGSI